MKKILIINTKYRIFGGEDSNISDEINLLSKFYDVRYLEFDNSKSFSFNDLFSFFIGKNIKSNNLLKRAIKEFNPDIAYVHNLWFKGQVGIFNLLKLYNIPTVHKIHNFRYFCCNSILIKKHLNNQKQCFMCGMKIQKNKIFNSYYFNSKTKSLLLILFTKKYLKYLKNNKILLFALNEFHKQKLIDIGICEEKIFVFFNPISTLELGNYNYNPKSNYVVYAGRIEENKGIEELLDSWSKFESKEIKLKIIGDGNLKDIIQKNYRKIKNIEFLGLLSNEETKKWIQGARAVLTTTKLYEGHPKLLAEASSLGVPSIYPSFGGMNEYFPKNYELSFEQFNYNDFIKKLNKVYDTSLMESLGQQVFDKTLEILSEETLVNKFKNITNLKINE